MEAAEQEKIDAARYRRLRAICLRMGMIHIAQIRDEAQFDSVVDNAMTVVKAPSLELIEDCHDALV